MTHVAVRDALIACLAVQRRYAGLYAALQGAAWAIRHDLARAVSAREVPAPATAG